MMGIGTTTMADEQNTVERTSQRQIVERLLLCLEEDPHAVAIMFSLKDLHLVIRGLSCCPIRTSDEGRRKVSLITGLEQLRRETFGE